MYGLGISVRARDPDAGTRAELGVSFAAPHAPVAAPRPSVEHLIPLALQPAFLEIRNMLNVLLGDISLLGLAVGDVKAIVDLVRNADEMLSRDGRDRAFSALRDAFVTNQDLRVTHERLEVNGRRLTAYLLALESGLACPGRSVNLSTAIELAGEMATHVTRNVGGFRWHCEGTDTMVFGSKPAAVVEIAAALSLIAEGLGDGATRGIVGRLTLEGESAVLTLSAPEATEDVYHETCAGLAPYAREGDGRSIAKMSTCVSLRWQRRTPRPSAF